MKNILLSGLMLILLVGSASADFTSADFDGDGKSDWSVFRPSTGIFYVLNSATGTLSATSWGTVCDRAVDGDFDGDGRADVGIWRPSTGTWWIKPSGGGPSIIQNWGLGSLGDIPVPGDYNGDGITDLGIYRPGASSGATSGWHIKFGPTWTNWTNGSWGLAGDIPVAATYKDCNCP
ncbi:MAG TPA: VCBS repeat-containing protein [Pyrinomonadaceae bacterium]|nr:VCBS repeat-containing protein [Pyrinomonadaceae bacterium]